MYNPGLGVAITGRMQGRGKHVPQQIRLNSFWQKCAQRNICDVLVLNFWWRSVSEIPNFRIEYKMIIIACFVMPLHFPSDISIISIFLVVYKLAILFLSAIPWSINHCVPSVISSCISLPHFLTNTGFACAGAGLATAIALRPFICGFIFRKLHSLWFFLSKA